MGEYIYVDRDGKEIKCKTRAEYTRRFAYRCLEDIGLSYQGIIELKGQTIILQMEDDHKYYELNHGYFGREQFWIRTSPLLIPLRIEQIFLDIIYTTVRIHILFEDFIISSNYFDSGWNGKILELTELNIIEATIHFSLGLISDDSEQRVMEKPYTWIYLSPNNQRDVEKPDLYQVKGSILLPNGEVIGD